MESRDQDLGDLLRRSAGKDETAWHELVRRFAGLVAFVIRHYRLNPADTQDVSQLVWLRLVEHLSDAYLQVRIDRLADDTRIIDLIPHAGDWATRLESL